MTTFCLLSYRSQKFMHCNLSLNEFYFGCAYTVNQLKLLFLAASTTMQMSKYQISHDQSLPEFSCIISTLDGNPSPCDSRKNTNEMPRPSQHFSAAAQHLQASRNLISSLQPEGYKKLKENR